MILCTGGTLSIDEAWLPETGARGDQCPGTTTAHTEEPGEELIEAALARSGGKVAGADGATATLGIPPSTLASKLRELKIQKRRLTRPARGGCASRPAA